MEYLTITAISQQLGIPESTLRYYAKNHGEFLPSKGEGRKKRYSSECAEVLRLIADRYKDRKTAMEINEELSKSYSRIIEVDNLPQRNTTTTQQLENATLQTAMIDLSNSLTIIANQQKQIDDLSERLEKLEQRTAIPQQSLWSRIFRK